MDRCPCLKRCFWLLACRRRSSRNGLATRTSPRRSMCTPTSCRQCNAKLHANWPRSSMGREQLVSNGWPGYENRSFFWALRGVVRKLGFELRRNANFHKMCGGGNRTPRRGHAGCPRERAAKLPGSAVSILCNLYRDTPSPNAHPLPLFKTRAAPAGQFQRQFK